MADELLIDGNNLMYALRALGHRVGIGRVAVMHTVERWAAGARETVIIVFDGPTPAGGMKAQLSSKVLDVRFSGHRTADDVLMDMMAASATPQRVRVVTGDGAIQVEARRHGCRITPCEQFVEELYRGVTPTSSTKTQPVVPDEKPAPPSRDETDAWLDRFGVDDDEFHDTLDDMLSE